MEFKLEVDREIDGLNDDLANSIWQLLIYSAPYDTGNLRSAIKKQTSNKHKIMFIYDLSQALYIEFLEQGLGFIKKYKGFIENKSVGEAIQETIYWATTDKTTYGGVPTIVLRGRLTKKAGRTFEGGAPIGYEKKILVDTKTPLTAKERNLLSQLNYKMFNGTPKIGQYKGKSANIEKSPFIQNSRFTKKGFNL